jgi:methionine-S-sulfoxide reductase
VGYSGGTQPDPTYHRLGDHTETVEIDFDPARITYAQLLDVFWASHRPTGRAWSRQYMAAVFYHGETQRQLAFDSRAERARQEVQPIRTEILPAKRFYRAEDYHQKYYLRQTGALMREFEGLYPHSRDFSDSTLAARFNGFAGGNGGLVQFRRELAALPLTAAEQARLPGLLARLEP